MRQSSMADLEALAIGSGIVLVISAGIAWLIQRPFSDVLANSLLIIGAIVAISSLTVGYSPPSMDPGGPLSGIPRAYLPKPTGLSPQPARSGMQRAFLGLGLMGFGGIAVLAPIPVAIAILAFVGVVAVLRGYKFARRK